MSAPKNDLDALDLCYNFKLLSSSAYVLTSQKEIFTPAPPKLSDLKPITKNSQNIFLHPFEAVVSNVKHIVEGYGIRIPQEEEVIKKWKIVKIETKKITDNRPCWPVKGKVTSPFGMRLHPVSKVNRFHRGIDIRAGYGTPILSPADGEVIAAGREGAFGRLVRIKTAMGNKTLLFGHLHRIKCKVGQKITKGQLIGTVGSSGRSTGPHLHFGVLDSKKEYINPILYLNSR
ncbi:MAG: M23 family metallopeptidase [Candidatus Riflebacteria bacterium]|nr:M23 family metallopeptidase [Candidatus Riflebacteria bacterium]